MQYGLGILEHHTKGQKIMAKFNDLLHRYQFYPQLWQQ
jgi:hypothetical protein